MEFHGKPFLTFILLVSIHLLLRSLLLPHPLSPSTTALCPTHSSPSSHRRRCPRGCRIQLSFSTVTPPPIPARRSATLPGDVQTITPEALESVKAAIASSDVDHKTDAKRKAVPRRAAGQTWEDPSLAEWPENDHRLFCGDLGNEVNDDVLSKAFTRFPSFNMARVVRDKRSACI